MAEVSVRAGERVPELHKLVTQEVISLWAGVSGDFNPLHTDAEFAAKTRFGGTIAHGHLALAWLCELLLRWRGASWLSGGELLGVRFVAPIRPGGEYRVTGVVSEVDEHRAVISLEVCGESGQCVSGEAIVPMRQTRSRKETE